MLNFSVNGAQYGVVFYSNPAIIAHPRKGLEQSDIVIATLFGEQGVVATGWSLRSPKDAWDDERGLKEAFARLITKAFPGRTPEATAARESFWKQYRMSMAVQEESVARANEFAARTTATRDTDLSNLVYTLMDAAWDGMSPTTASPITNGVGITSNTTKVDPSVPVTYTAQPGFLTPDAPPPTVLTHRDTADEVADASF